MVSEALRQRFPNGQNADDQVMIEDGQPRLEYLHECQPPPVDVDNPGRRRWYCSECGTLWWFLRTMIGRRVKGEWRPVKRVAESQSRVTAKITEEAAVELWLAMGEGPNYSPSWSELVERAEALRNRCQYLEEGGEP